MALRQQVLDLAEGMDFPQTEVQMLMAQAEPAVADATRAAQNAARAAQTVEHYVYSNSKLERIFSNFF